MTPDDLLGSIRLKPFSLYHLEVPDRPLLLVDGDNLAHRAYHAVPKTIKSKDGRPINAIVGWTNMILAVWEAERPRQVFVAWDTLGVPTYRHTLWPPYQQGRVFDEALLQQLDALPSLTAAFGFGMGKEPGYEADDFLASAAACETAAGGSCLILTNDRDAFQLVSDAVTVLLPVRGISELARVDPKAVVERLGVLPEQVPDYKALAGDPSDNIPGAAGVGPKSAAALLLRHGTLDNVLENRPRADGDRLLMFRKVVQMQADRAVQLPVSGEPRWNEAAAALADLGADALARRVSERARRLL